MLSPSLPISLFLSPSHSLGFLLFCLWLAAVWERCVEEERCRTGQIAVDTADVWTRGFPQGWLKTRQQHCRHQDPDTQLFFKISFLDINRFLNHLYWSSFLVLFHGCYFGSLYEGKMRSKFSQAALQPFILGVFLSLVDTKGTFYGTGHGNPFFGGSHGNRYNLYKAGVNPHYSPGKPMTRHK